MPTDTAKKPKELEIEVFKTGEITDSAGDTKTWSLEDLNTIANTYNDSIATDPGAEAPIVKGHPETDAPALGWVKSLQVVGDKLKAKISIISDFAEEVSKEMYKKVSIALKDDLMLRHIGFLGAVQPAVKGLEPVKFSEGKFNTYNYADIVPADPNAATQTLEEWKAQQEVRATTYGIGVKDKIGYVQKPDAYKDLADEDFADPTNYLYPLNDLANLIASKETFRSWDSSYTDVERQVIIARFLRAAQNQGIDILKDKLYFAEDGPTFAITLNDKLKREKPATYAEYTDGDFGDPVHFRFPLKSKSEVKASMAIFSRENVKGQYSEKEQQYIASRIILAAQSYAIALTPKTWSYGEVQIPVEVLSRKQLEDYVNKSIQKTNISQYSKGQTMKEWLVAFVAAMTQKLSETVNEEVATQFQAWVDEYKTATPLPAEATPPADGGSQNSDPEIPKQYAERMEKLEKENRLMKHESYFREMSEVKGILVPAQKDLVFAALEMGFEKKTAFFSEKEIPATDLVKKLIESFPAQVEFNEVASKKNAETKKSSTFSAPDGMVADEQAEKMHVKVLAYMEAQEKAGTKLSYKQALQTVSTTNS